MLLSIAVLLLTAMLFSKICQILKLPPLVGMIIAGIVLGSSLLNILSNELLLVSKDFREFALIIILLRAGLNLDFNNLKKAGVYTILLSFIPALCEILAITLIAPTFLDINYLQAMLIGSIVAAVSPAVIVPRMIFFIKNKYGTNKAIPEMIMTSASLDDILVIMIFTILLGLNQNSTIDYSTFINLPLSIISGFIIGYLTSKILNYLFKLVNIRDSNKVIIVLACSFLLVGLEDLLVSVFTFSSLISIMSFGMFIKLNNEVVAIPLANKLSKIWIFAELMLFSLVGASLNLSASLDFGYVLIIIVVLALIIRFISVILCLSKSSLSMKERLFVGFSYLPKATVQAAIGPIPLALGLVIGDLAISIAVISILISAPLGAILIDNTYQNLIDKSS